MGKKYFLVLSLNPSCFNWCPMRLILPPCTPMKGLFLTSVWVLAGRTYIPLKPPLLEVEQAQFHQSPLIQKVFQPQVSWESSIKLAPVWQCVSCTMVAKLDVVYSRCGLMSAQQRGTIASFELLAVSCSHSLVPSWPSLPPWHTAGSCTACCTPRPPGPEFSAELFPNSLVPNLYWCQ